MRDNTRSHISIHTAPDLLLGSAVVFDSAYVELGPDGHLATIYADAETCERVAAEFITAANLLREAEAAA